VREECISGCAPGRRRAECGADQNFVLFRLVLRRQCQLGQVTERPPVRDSKTAPYCPFCRARRVPGKTYAGSIVVFLGGGIVELDHAGNVGYRIQALRTRGCKIAVEFVSQAKVQGKARSNLEVILEEPVEAVLVLAE